MHISDFTYSAYKNLLLQISKESYKFVTYGEAIKNPFKKCILRHDIDLCIEKAIRIADIEVDLGIRSTFFVLLKTDFYNPYSLNSLKYLKYIMSLGHEIGLHFDEKSYGFNERIPEMIIKEVELLSEIIDRRVNVVSMHRPSEKTLSADYKIEGIINSYSERFFKEYKYISDSRRCWRENAEEVIISNKYENLHILTHPFWYNDTSTDIIKSLSEFINNSKNERYIYLKDNFTNLNQYISGEDYK